MATRGPAPTAVCPRCGAEAPPADERLVHCTECKLAFDPKAEPVVPPQRRFASELVDAPPGFVIKREPGEVTIQWSLERMKGVAALLLAAICIAMLIGNLGTPGENWKELALLAVAGAFMAYAGVAFTFGEIVLRIDERQLTVRREPLPLRRGVWVGLGEIESIQLDRPGGRDEPYWVVSAITPRGKLTLATFADGNRGAGEAATCVADVVRDALADMAAS